MNIQKVNVISSKYSFNSAEKLSKVNFSQSTAKSVEKDSFSTKLKGYTEEDLTSGPFGFAC